MNTQSNVRRGKAQTVLQLIHAADLGPTLSHDHLVIDTRWLFKEPSEASLKSLAHQKIGLQNLGWINYNWTSNADNCSVLEEDTAIAEVMRFVGAGGRTIVDPTNIGLGRDPHSLAKISRLTGANIIMGAGYYLEKTLPPELADRSQEAITEEIIRDIEIGVGDTGIRAGLIGEIGCSYPMTDVERRSLRASVDAQRQTGAPLMVHPGRDPKSPFEIVEVVRRAGGDLSRMVICHIDRTCTDRGWLAELAATGCYLEYDLFGNETSYYCQNPKVDMPSDAQRMDIVLWHFEQGLEKQLLISHDIATKTRLSRYGGLGYDHILTNIVPRLRIRGLKEEGIRRLLIDNPAAAFSFA
ncbi:MAG: phosphotriesterase [Dongiaceae bacterium]